MKRKYIFAILILALAIFCAYSFASQNIEKKKNDLNAQMSLFSEALTIIRSDYVDEVKPHDLIYGALKGMLSALDPYSQFMDPDTYNELKVDTHGQFGGLGIEVAIKDGLLTVIAPIDDTPAWRAGIKANDRIVKINQELTRDITLTDAVKKLRGKPGDPVVLTILRESNKKILEFRVTRDIIKIKDIKDARILEDGIGYIRLTEFRENAAEGMTVALGALKGKGMNALILDLRNNPGGLLDVAIKVTENFVEKGKLIVALKGRKASQNMDYYSSFNHHTTDIPLVVLINEGSASGSEILAGCIKDYKRGVILGTKSFGKGLVQTVIPLSDGSALRLTTSRYFTPSGKQINGKGITPDITVEDTGVELPVKDDKEKIEDVFATVEKFQNEKNAKNKDKEETPDYKTDIQLKEALNLIKAIRVYKNISK